VIVNEDLIHERVLGQATADFIVTDENAELFAW